MSDTKLARRKYVKQVKPALTPIDCPVSAIRLRALGFSLEMWSDRLIASMGSFQLCKRHRSDAWVMQHGRVTMGAALTMNEVRVACASLQLELK